MHQVCILTDNSVQFINPGFMGNELVFTFPFSTRNEVSSLVNDPMIEMKDPYGIEPPPVHEIQKRILNVHKDHSAVLVITLSSALSRLYNSVEKAVEQIGDLGSIRIIDSRTTSIGMGVLVQMAAGLAAQGATIQQIEHHLRISIPDIYTLLCLPNLSQLAAANFLSPSQAVVGEMLGVLPIFSLENVSLTSIQKVRTQRHLLETFQEFVDEFIDPYYVAIIKKPENSKMLNFREYLSSNHPRTAFGEHVFGDPLMDLLGPQSVGLIVVEKKIGGNLPPNSWIH